ncbi:MAG: hypothetical protein ACOX42_09850 [Clostridia bacterium]
MAEIPENIRKVLINYLKDLSTEIDIRLKPFYLALMPKVIMV